MRFIMLSNSKELQVIDFITELIQSRGWVLYSEARDSSAERFDLSVVTTARYIDKMKSKLGQLIEERTSEGRILKLKEKRSE